MIFLPPRHGKSELAAVRYPAWRLKRDPTLNIILASHSQRLANRFSRKIKRVLADDAIGSAGALACMDAKASRRPARNHGSLDGNVRHAGGTGVAGEGACAPRMFPFISQRPANSMAEWETAAGGGLRSVGVGSGVAGYGAHLVVIDDPVKNRAQANSETFRDAMYSWYMDDIYTRLEPNGAIILIQTRWHEDDLAGRLIRDMDAGGDQWEVISLPALAEESEPPALAGGTTSALIDDREHRDDTTLGERVNSTPDNSMSKPPAYAGGSDILGRKAGQALCPDRYNEEALDQTRRNLGSWSFAALYQQRPAPAEGGTFKRAWFKNIVERAPQGLEWKRGTDLAVSTKTTADYTASFRCAFDRDGNLYIDGGFRRRIEFPEQRRYLIERICQETDTEHGIEEALHGRAFIQDLRRDERLRGHKFKGVKVEGDKLARALSWQNLAEEGRLRLVRGPWNRDFIEEACQFPHGHHDDQIDAVSLAVSMFQQKHGTYGF